MLGSRLEATVVEQSMERLVTAVPVRGGHVRFFTPSARACARAESLLTKETDTIQWIDRFAAGDVFWDVGANVGVGQHGNSSDGGEGERGAEEGAARRRAHATSPSIASAMTEASSVATMPLGSDQGIGLLSAAQPTSGCSSDAAA